MHITIFTNRTRDSPPHIWDEAISGSISIL